MDEPKNLADALSQMSDEEHRDKLRQQVHQLKENANRYKRELEGTRHDLAASKEETEEVYTELSLYKRDFSEKPKWLTKKHKDKSHHATLLAMLSDTHYSEVVNPLELGGYNKYNMAIAELRTQKFFENILMLSRNYLAGTLYDGITLALGGDLVSGDIHEELVETNEHSTLRTVETVIPWLAKGIEMLCDEFPNVHIVSAPGNHGRNTKKPRHKKRSENNSDTHIANILAFIFENQSTPIDGLTFDIPESADVDFQIYNYVFSMEHGDNLRFNGTSEIGSLGPVKRGNLRKTKKRQEQGRPFKYGMYGHFHQFVPAYTQGFIMNGSLKGYDEYASDGQFSPEPAQQALAVVTPEHGITITAPILVQDRDKEGW